MSYKLTLKNKSGLTTKRVEGVRGLYEAMEAAKAEGYEVADIKNLRYRKLFVIL